MSRKPCTFKQRDVTAAARAMRAAGYQVEGVQVNNDGFRIIVASNAAAKEDDLDRELTQFVEGQHGQG